MQIKKTGKQKKNGGNIDDAGNIGQGMALVLVFMVIVDNKIAQKNSIGNH